MTDAWRLTFAYHGDDFTLKSVSRVTKRIPRSQYIDGNHSACDVELRGEGNEVLYRRTIAHLIPDTVEYPTGDPARPFGRVAAPLAGEVAVLVPAARDGRYVALVGTRRRVIPTGEPNALWTAQANRPPDLIVVELPRVEEKGK